MGTVWHEKLISLFKSPLYCCQADIGGDIGDWEPDDAWPYGSVTSFNPYHCDLAALEVCLLVH